MNNRIIRIKHRSLFILCNFPFINKKKLLNIKSGSITCMNFFTFILVFF